MNPPTRAALLVALALSSLGACSDHHPDTTTPLPPGTQAICNAAHTHNARTVYNVRDQPQDTQLKTLAHHIYPGSGATNDEKTITAITHRCTDLGYHAPS